MKMKRIKAAALLGLLSGALLFAVAACTQNKTDSSSSASYSAEMSDTTENKEESSLGEISETSNADQSDDFKTEENSSSVAENSSVAQEDSSIENESSADSAIDREDSSSVEETPAPLPHVHEYKLQLIREPDCETAGILMYICACNDYYTETPEALGHLPVTDVAVAPTCVKNGLTEGSHCSRCDEILQAQESVALVPHTYFQGYCTVCDLAGLEFTVNEEEGYAICTAYTGKTVRRVVIPDEYYGYPVRELAAGLFEGCSDLYAIEIGANVEVIGEGAFHQCYHLVEIYDRSKARVTEYSALENGALTTNAEEDDIYYEPFESEIEIIDDFVIFNDDGERILLNYQGKDKKIFIPEGVTRIMHFALAGKPYIEEVTIASTVHKIDKYAFYHAEEMKMIYFLAPEGWEARKETKDNWTPFADGHLVGGENGRKAMIELYNEWEWRKVE